MKEQFHVGSKFKIIGRHGSFGIITHIRRDGPFAGNPGYYGTFYYGVDARGREVTEHTGMLNASAIEPVTETQFAAHRARRFNGGSEP